MAISTIRAKINGAWTTLTWNSGTSKYEATIAAPAITSFNVNAGHYYAVTVEATDQAGNVTTKDDTDGTLGNSLKLVVKEVTKPTITFTAPASGGYLSSNTPTISFQLRDETNGSGVKISTLALKVDGGTTITNVSAGVTVSTVTGGFDVSYVPQTSLTDGSHTVTIDVADNDGNTATQATRSFTVDTVPPALSITTPADATSYQNVAARSIIGVTNDATSSPVVITIKLNGVDQGAVSVDGGGNFTKNLTLANGSNTIVIKATDLAGKFTEVTRTVILDTVAPTITAITITPNPVNVGQSYLVAVTASDA